MRDIAAGFGGLKLRLSGVRWWAATFWLALSLEVAVGGESFCLLIEPSDGPMVKRMLKGGRVTALVPGKETDVGGVRYYTASEFEALDLGWGGFRKRAEATAERVWAKLKPEVEKDGKGFVRSAVVRGTSHLTASAVLAPKFYETFRATMGDDLVVLIPDRFTIYVFPRPMGEYKAMGPKILEAYADATYPVSYEVLLLNKEGLSVLGSFRAE
ncbi:MAG: hypothetical protein ACKV19_26710 [Verrucomicrobiales bacterium]